MGMRMGGPMLRPYISSESTSAPKLSRSLLKRVFQYAQPYRWPIAGMLGLITLSAGLTLVTPLILRRLIDTTIPNKDVPELVTLALGLLLLPIMGSGLNIFQRRLNAGVGEGVIYDLRMALYTHLQRMSLRFFTNTKVGELMSRLNSDVVGAQNAISNTIVAMVTNIIQTVGVLTVMFLMEWRLTLVSIMIFPLFLLAIRAMGRRLQAIAREQMQVNAQMNAMMNETLNIGGALLVKLFGRMDTEVSRFDKRAAAVRDLGVQRAVLGVIFFGIIGLLAAVGTALVYGIGGYLVIIDVFTVGTIVAFGSYLTSLYASLQGLAAAPVEFATSVVSFERVFEVLDLPLDIPEKGQPLELGAVRGELVFDEVTFRYSSGSGQGLSEAQRWWGAEAVSTALSNEEDRASHTPIKAATNGHHQAREDALQGVSFHIEPGQLVALVGPSGAGKTTLTYLIPRLYDPSEGRVLLDGHDLRDVSLASLSAQIGMVTQETYLFHDTIRTNLTYAKLDATDDEIIAAGQAANIHDFIMGLPDGYETVVGERGYRLSGGEKQRLAIARVLLKDPRLLILDEATSHLDSESEALIQEALGRVMQSRTSIVIAHRLSTILAADHIFVVDRGQVVERGRHEDLLALGGLYSRLYETQFAAG